MIKPLRRKLASFLNAPRFTKLWFIPAWLLLGLSRTAVLVVPFRKIARWLGRAAGTTAAVPLLTSTQRQQALLIGRTVRLAARYAPWNANCFAQAITAGCLLRVYCIPHSVFFGLKRADAPQKSMDAHAWTAAGDISVTGGYSFNVFTVVAAFHKTPNGAL